MGVFRDIKWFDYKDGTGSTASFLVFEYDIWQEVNTNKWSVTYYDRLTEEPSKDATGFNSIDDAKEWSEEHKCLKLKPYLKM